MARLYYDVLFPALDMIVSSLLLIMSSSGYDVLSSCYDFMQL